MDLFTQHNYLVIVLHLLFRCRHHVFVVSRIDYMYYLSFDFLIICHYSPHFNLTFSIIASFSCSSPIWFIVDFTTDTYTFFRMVDLRFYTLDLPFKVTMTKFFICVWWCTCRREIFIFSCCIDLTFRWFFLHVLTITI